MEWLDWIEGERRMMNDEDDIFIGERRKKEDK